MESTRGAECEDTGEMPGSDRDGGIGRCVFGGCRVARMPMTIREDSAQLRDR